MLDFDRPHKVLLVVKEKRHCLAVDPAQVLEIKVGMIYERTG